MYVDCCDTVVDTLYGCKCRSCRYCHHCKDMVFTIENKTKCEKCKNKIMPLTGKEEDFGDLLD